MRCAGPRKGSARCLGRDDIGEIAVGKQADLAMFTLDELRFSGAGDPHRRARPVRRAPRRPGDGGRPLAGDRRHAAGHRRRQAPRRARRSRGVLDVFLLIGSREDRNDNGPCRRIQQPRPACRTIPPSLPRWHADAKAYRERRRRAGHRPMAPCRATALTCFPRGGGGQGPLVVFIHGGYWLNFDKSVFSHMARGANAHGLTSPCRATRSARR